MSFLQQLFQDPGKTLEDTANSVLPILAGGAATFFSGGNPVVGGLAASLTNQVIQGGKGHDNPATSGTPSPTGTPQQRAAYAADPFAQQRPQYQQMLQKLMTDPGSFSQTPQSIATTKEGMDQMQAQMAQRGIAGSGAEKAALTKYATTAAGQDYNNQMARLMTLSGATGGAPGTAGGILSNAATEQQTAQDTGTNSLLQLGAKAFGDWWNQPSAQDMTGFQQPSQPIQYQVAAPDTSMGSGMYNPQPTMSGGALGSGTFDLGLSY